MKQIKLTLKERLLGRANRPSLVARLQRRDEVVEEDTDQHSAMVTSSLSNNSATAIMVWKVGNGWLMQHYDNKKNYNTVDSAQLNFYPNLEALSAGLMKIEALNRLT